VKTYANTGLRRGKHVSYQRGKRNTNPGTSLIKIEGVDDSKAATFYNGKRIAYVYRAKKEIRGTKIRVIWGKITRPHGMFCHTLGWQVYGSTYRQLTGLCCCR
jgi:large subunit ribosomal protein L35Ae